MLRIRQQVSTFNVTSKNNNASKFSCNGFGMIVISRLEVTVFHNICLYKTFEKYVFKITKLQQDLQSNNFNLCSKMFLHFSYQNNEICLLHNFVKRYQLQLYSNYIAFCCCSIMLRPPVESLMSKRYARRCKLEMSEKELSKGVFV